MKKIAVVLINLGGPDQLSAVRPFLFNLFNDKAIISLPQPFRWILARWVSFKRNKIAQDIYSQIGGQSPILAFTKHQQQSLQQILNHKNFNGCDIKIFTAMRYWHPLIAQVYDDVANWNADEVILLPLYPQFSTTTTGSAFAEWKRLLNLKPHPFLTRYICCYPGHDDWVKGQLELIKPYLSQALALGSVRLLFSAHGLPQKIIDQGDPYVSQINFGAERIATAVIEQYDRKADLSWAVCYQSKVGPLQWTKPSLEEEIKRASLDQVAVVIVPISFVSEHSETLYELDIEYSELARINKIIGFFRVPTLSVNQFFISCLSKLVENSIHSDALITNGTLNNDCEYCLASCWLHSDVK